MSDVLYIILVCARCGQMRRAVAGGWAQGMSGWEGKAATARDGRGMMRGNGPLVEGPSLHLEQKEMGMFVLVHEEDTLHCAALALPLVLFLHSR